MENNKGLKFFAVIMAVMMFATMAVSTVSLATQATLKKDVDKVIGTKLDVEREDDVVICDEYTILSTKHISDAYLSGDTSALSDQDKETLDMAEAVLKKVIKKGMTDYEKEKAVYEYLTRITSQNTGLLTLIPTTTQDNATPYGVLKYKQAVCVGYATTFRLLMQMLEIECMVEHSTDLVHSWNLVKLDDEWYLVDCYTDADEKNFANFNITDTEHSYAANLDFFPAATGTKYSFAAMNAKTISDIFALPEAVKEAIENKETVAAFRFKSGIKQGSEEDVAKVMVSKLEDTLTGVYYDYTFDFAWSKDDNNDYILKVSMYNYSLEDVLPEISDESSSAIDDSIVSVFGENDFGDSGDFGDEDFTPNADIDSNVIAKG